MKASRQIVLDTETTGLDPTKDRVIEIGCVELVNRRLTNNNYHQYINPLQEIGQGAIDVHGITNEFLSDKPLFADIVYPFLDYVRGAGLVIHNASFDVGFLNHEMQNFDPSIGTINDYCQVIDSLALAREMHPGQRNDLDTLARRYDIDNSHRKLHGALLDSEILADVYLLMSGGQSALSLEEDAESDAQAALNRASVDYSGFNLPVLMADAEEVQSHADILLNIEKETGERSLWSHRESGSVNDVAG